jgi:hypothetical protein
MKKNRDKPPCLIWHWQRWDSNPRLLRLVPKTSALDHSATLPIFINVLFVYHTGKSISTGLKVYSCVHSLFMLGEKIINGSLKIQMFPFGKFIYTKLFNFLFQFYFYHQHFLSYCLLFELHKVFLLNCLLRLRFNINIFFGKKIQNKKRTHL